MQTSDNLADHAGPVLNALAAALVLGLVALPAVPAVVLLLIAR